MNPDEGSNQLPSILADIDADLQARGTPPDLVLDLISRLSPPPNPYDTLKRPRLPDAVYSMELEWPAHPIGIAERIITINRKVGPWLTVTFCLSALVLAPLVGLFGRGVLSPLTYPLICFACGLIAFFRLIATSSVTSAARWFVLPQVAAILIEWSYSPAISPSWSLLPVCFAIGGVGYLADRVNTHFVWLITANLNLSREAVVRRRSMWSHRFDRATLSREISALRDQVQELEQSGDSDEISAIRERIANLLELREYPLGFVGLIYMAVLHWTGVPSTPLVIGGFAISILLAFRRPVMTMRIRRLIAEVNAYSFLSWFSWDPKQPWVHSPGIFRDGLYSPYQRLTQSVSCFFLIQIAFTPPLYQWGVGDAFTPEWLWRMGYYFFLNLFLPLFLVLCALVSTGARPLWMHLAAVEWAEGSDAWD